MRSSSPPQNGQHGEENSTVNARSETFVKVLPAFACMFRGPSRKGQDATLAADIVNVCGNASASVRGCGVGDGERCCAATPQAQDERNELSERAAGLGDREQPVAMRQVAGREDGKMEMRMEGMDFPGCMTFHRARSRRRDIDYALHANLDANADRALRTHPSRRRENARPSLKRSMRPPSAIEGGEILQGMIVDGARPTTLVMPATTQSACVLTGQPPPLPSSSRRRYPVRQSCARLLRYGGCQGSADVVVLFLVAECTTALPRW